MVVCYDQSVFSLGMDALCKLFSDRMCGIPKVGVNYIWVRSLSRRALSDCLCACPGRLRHVQFTLVSLCVCPNQRKPEPRRSPALPSHGAPRRGATTALAVYSTLSQNTMIVEDREHYS